MEISICSNSHTVNLYLIQFKFWKPSNCTASPMSHLFICHLCRSVSLFPRWPRGWSWHGHSRRGHLWGNSCQRNLRRLTRLFVQQPNTVLLCSQHRHLQPGISNRLSPQVWPKYTDGKRLRHVTVLLSILACLPTCCDIHISRLLVSRLRALRAVQLLRRTDNHLPVLSVSTWLTGH